MRISIQLGREILEEASNAVAVGVTTDEIDRIVHEACIERECYPSPLNYYEFPKSCCTSINEVICHGIPDLRPLKDGDICNSKTFSFRFIWFSSNPLNHPHEVDITAYHRGFHGDLNETIYVGEVSESAKKLVQVTYECLEKAIAIGT